MTSHPRLGPDPPPRARAGAGLRRTDRGMVTAEIALGVPAVLILLAVVLWVVLVVTAQLRVVDAARTGARAAARGESLDQVAELAEDLAPAGATAVVTRSGSDVRVHVAVDVEPIGGLPLLPTVEVGAVAHAVAEDSISGGTAEGGESAMEGFAGDAAGRDASPGPPR